MEDQTSENEEVIDGEIPTETSEATETEQKETSVKEGIDYAVKFAESSKEAQRLYKENQSLQAQQTAYQAELERLKEADQIESLREVDPQAYQSAKTEKSLREMQEMLVTEREERLVSDFIAKTPEASAQREALKKLGRIEPKKSFGEIWGEYFKPAIDHAGKTAELRAKTAKMTQEETGKGSASGDMTGDVFSSAFNKLSLEKRKEAFKKMGL